MSGIVDEVGYPAGSDPILNCTWTSVETAELAVTWYTGSQTIGEQEGMFGTELWFVVQKHGCVTMVTMTMCNHGNV